jgi:L-ascorbate metabolism protein UlaG (beta-lactamase superfamily)
MRVDFIGHACVVIRADSGAVCVIDPWIHEPVFAQRWYRYPPQDLGAIPREPDVLALSHAHPDHAGTRTLDALKPGTVVTCRFTTDHLGRRVRKRFSDRLQVLEPWRGTTVGDFRITAIASDLGWEDGSFVVEVEGVRIYHGNDNPLGVESYRRIKRELGPIDLALLPFAGASSYPTCFAWPADRIAQAAQAKKEEALDRFRDGVRELEPRAAVPFASHWALLDEGFIDRNFSDRYTVDEAAERAAREFPSVRILPAAPGDLWNSDGGFARGPDHDKWPQTRQAVRSYAETLHPSARRSDEPPGKEDLERLSAQLAELAAKVDLVARICIVVDGHGAWCLEAGRLTRSERAPDADEIVHLGAADATRLARGQNRWEDLWYGYALRVEKKPGTPYYRAFWEALLEYQAPGFESIGE